MVQDYQRCGLERERAGEKEGERLSNKKFRTLLKVSHKKVPDIYSVMKKTHCTHIGVILKAS